MPQIWGSDDTDAICRTYIQNGYSYGYPQSAIGAHVSGCPNHQTLRETPLATRFNVAAFGLCGYECNLAEMKKEEVQEIKEQISLYKEWRDVLQYGTFYRGRSDNIYEWTCVSQDKSKAVGLVLQKLVEPNTTYEQFTPKGLDENKKYHFYNIEKKRNVKLFGDLVNAIAPIHIKNDSVLHNVIDKVVKMPGEVEDYTAYGDVLMSGVKLKSAFCGTGYDENTRFFKDFESRLYFMEEIK
jgi:alpha-galactosidase